MIERCTYNCTTHNNCIHSCAKSDQQQQQQLDRRLQLIAQKSATNTVTTTISSISSSRCTFIPKRQQEMVHNIRCCRSCRCCCCCCTSSSSSASASSASPPTPCALVDDGYSTYQFVLHRNDASTIAIQTTTKVRPLPVVSYQHHEDDQCHYATATEPATATTTTTTTLVSRKKRVSPMNNSLCFGNLTTILLITPFIFIFILPLHHHTIVTATFQTIPKQLHIDRGTIWNNNKNNNCYHRKPFHHHYGDIVIQQASNEYNNNKNHQRYYHRTQQHQLYASVTPTPITPSTIITTSSTTTTTTTTTLPPSPTIPLHLDINKNDDEHHDQGNNEVILPNIDPKVGAVTASSSVQQQQSPLQQQIQTTFTTSTTPTTSPIKQQQQQQDNAFLNTNQDIDTIIPFYANLYSSNNHNTPNTLLPTSTKNNFDPSEQQLYQIQQQPIPNQIVEHQQKQPTVYRPRFYNIAFQWIQQTLKRTLYYYFPSQQQQQRDHPTKTIRSIWRHRHARSFEEGIRREYVSDNQVMDTTDTTSDRRTQLQESTNRNLSNSVSSNNHNNHSNNNSNDKSNNAITNNRRNAVRRLSSIFAKANTSIERTSRRVAARTLTGLITAMAEEVQDLTVEVDARDETPYRNKHITAVRIQFSRLGFKPLRLGGHNSPSDRKQQREAVANHHSLLMDQFRFKRKSSLLPRSMPVSGSSNTTVRINNRNKRMGIVTWTDDDYKLNDDVNDKDLPSDRIDADEAFDRIDADKSGFLDKKELIQALGLAAIASNDKTLVLEDMESDSHVSILEELASDLFELYDVNGDGVVDRKEYKMMVADMAALRNRDRKRRRENEGMNYESYNPDSSGSNWFTSSIGFIQNKTISTLASSIELLQSKTRYLPSVEYITNQSGIITSGVTTGLKFVQNNSGFLTTGVEFVQNKTGFIYTGVEYVQNTTGLLASSSIDFIQNNTSFTEYVQNNTELITNSVEYVKGKLPWPSEQMSSLAIVANPEIVESVSKSLGSITFSDIKMDLRRLFFGAVPILKRIVPGGPLILEPFTTTITGSFNRNDILNSVLLDAGLRRLVMRALRRRVGFARDVLDGAIFKGRSWKTFGDETGGGPRVEIPELTNVEFDENDKLIITGRARVQPSPDAAVINQSFKVRTSIGTRKDGRFIRLEEPELALVLECPESWDANVRRVCDILTIEKPPRPSPLYTFFPIYSPFKLQDDDGFDLGEDNSITSLYIKDGALRFEMSAVLRPGRFLGSHYIAFSIPIRTFIVTLDRLVEGVRSARKVKKAAQRALLTSDRNFDGPKRLFQRFSFDRAGDALLGLNDDRVKRNSATSNKKTKMKSFFSRFIDGYLQAERDESKKERLTTAIQDFFGRQGI